MRFHALTPHAYDPASKGLRVLTSLSGQDSRRRPDRSQGRVQHSGGEGHQTVNHGRRADGDCGHGRVDLRGLDLCASAPA